MKANVQLSATMSIKPRHEGCIPISEPTQSETLKKQCSKKCSTFGLNRGGLWNLRHGHTSASGNSRTYNTWQRMKGRCRYPHHNRNFKNYGGRGIKVCERWQKFENFLADMGERPPGRTLDRINVDGNYEPGNCRWATPTDQAANSRRWRGRSSTVEHLLPKQGVACSNHVARLEEVAA